VLIVAPDGEVLETLDGPSPVAIPTQLSPILADAAKPVLLVHNHPASTGLSESDLALLAHPGVRTVIAVGHDGSLYQASMNVRIDSASFERSVYDVACTLLEEAMHWEKVPFDPHIAQENFAHLVALVLARAGVIEYRAALAGSRRTLWDTQLVFDRIVRSVGDELKKRWERAARP
jgi:hypothetical protein